MNTTEHDVWLLRAFTRQGAESAFGTLVHRHLRLVYGTAIRKVSDPAAAEEIAQDVFAALARSAWKFAPDDSVPAWLHRTTILKSKQWLRGEMRRRRREETAVQLGTTMKTPDEQIPFCTLAPLLDEALLSLVEKDRAALLLRYVESRSLREVGSSLGVSEDTAQKRVASALHRITGFFRRRGFKTASAALVAAALEQTTLPAPLALSQVVLQAAIQSGPPAVTGLTAVLAHIASLTKVQTAALCLLFAVVPLAWQWNRTRSAESSVTALEQNLNSALKEQEQAGIQTEGLRAEEARLERRAAPGVPRPPDRVLAGVRALAGLKERLIELAAAPEPRWPEDLPFVRVPKWALKNIGSRQPAFGPCGELSGWLQEVLDLSQEQKSSVESSLSQFLSTIDRLAASQASETNWTDADGFHHKTISVSPLGEEGKQAEEQLSTNLATMLGIESTQLVMSPLFSQNQYISPERIAHELIDHLQEFSLAVRPNGSEEPEVRISWQLHLGYGGPLVKTAVPPFLLDRFLPWLQQLGVVDAVFKNPTL